MVRVRKDFSSDPSRTSAVRRLGLESVLHVAGREPQLADRETVHVRPRQSDSVLFRHRRKTRHVH